MQSERRTILSLIAAGRISAAEAERLLALSEDRIEALWAIAACVATALLTQGQAHALLAGLAELFRGLLPEALAAAQQAHQVITQLSGGVI
jgi:hypothetical protein